jgi:hypothetical protein
MKDMVSIRKMRRPSLAVSRGEVDVTEDGPGALDARSSTVLDDFFLGGKTSKFSRKKAGLSGQLSAISFRIRTCCLLVGVLLRAES